MWRLELSEEYVRKAFSELAQLDVGDWMRLPNTGVLFKCWGNEVHIKDIGTINDKVMLGYSTAQLVQYADGKLLKYEFVMKEGKDRRVFVDEKRAEQREVTLEFGSKHMTNWWEVYRSGRHIRSTRFIDYLKLLYGEDKCPSKAKHNVDSCSQTIPA